MNKQHKYVFLFVILSKVLLLFTCRILRKRSNTWRRRTNWQVCK